MPGIKDKIAAAAGRLTEQRNRRGHVNLTRGTRARVKALFRRSSRLPGMPDAFDHAPLR